MAEPDGPAGSPRRSRVLLAEDDAAMRDLLIGWLHEAGYEVTACSDGLELLTNLEMSVLSGEIPEFDLLLSDIRMPLGSAVDVLDEFVGCDGLPPTILITSFGDGGTRRVARDLGAASVLDKPFQKDRLISEIRRLWPAPPGVGSAARRP